MNREVSVLVSMLVVGIFLAAGPATPANASPDQQSFAYADQKSSLLAKPANLDVKEVTLADALRTLRDRARVDITFSPSLLPQRIVSCSCTRATVEEALVRMLEGTGFDYLEMPLQIVIRPPQSAARESSRTLSDALREGAFAVLDRPVDLETMLEIMRRVLRR
jgi:hypothetical protein